MTVVIRDHGYLKIIKGLKALNGKSVTIGLHASLGIHPGENNRDHLTYAQIGAIQEFGAKRMFLDGAPIIIPSRPFTAESFDDNRANIWTNIQKAFTRGLTTGFFLEEMLIVGKKHAVYQQQKMIGWSDPPNSPRTIKYKLRNDPLNWTGAMISAVDAKIR